jgi:hypothetical protein
MNYFNRGKVIISQLPKHAQSRIKQRWNESNIFVSGKSKLKFDIWKSNLKIVLKELNYRQSYKFSNVNEFL